ncbi:SEC-C metal-binding domain-containing protein [Peribacillus sp. Bi134]|uniref:SEC-C metal-binding domain-containing protein n=1 Tax=Peribacillus sp. Bi134 TaxID=2884272 RepID=UPI001D2B4EF7|nr:SEC-C metal-binding domain-containing protein [Peribacillus sp. Bi134]CAH0149374.1 hypothetical protein SRABI134_00725 [Peribacillus sp. Bi134]
MPHMPAICDTCGTIFNSGLYIENAKGVTLSGNTAGPCPSCNNMGHIPDGIYNFVENALKVITPEKTIQELKAFEETIRIAQKNYQKLEQTEGLVREKFEEKAEEELEEKLEEKSPQLASFVNSLPANNETTNVWLQFFLSLLLLFIQNAIDEKPEPVQPTVIEINTVINNISTNTYVPNQNQPIVVEKVGRNELCPCDSGIKYKRCHGLNENQVTY